MYSTGLNLENLPGGTKIGFQKKKKKIGGGGAYLATLRLCHLLYNHVNCMVGVSRGQDLSKISRGRVRFCQGPPP